MTCQINTNYEQDYQRALGEYHQTNLHEKHRLDASWMGSPELVEKTMGELSQIHEVEFHLNRLISDEDLAAFLLKIPHLRKLIVKNCDVTEKFLQLLSRKAVVFYNLTEFLLEGNQINTREFPNMHALFPKLKEAGKGGLIKRKPIDTPGTENHTPLFGRQINFIKTKEEQPMLVEKKSSKLRNALKSRVQPSTQPLQGRVLIVIPKSVKKAVRIVEDVALLCRTFHSIALDENSGDESSSMDEVN